MAMGDTVGVVGVFVRTAGSSDAIGLGGSFTNDGGVAIDFFFRAEDGIRDADVTGVQTCALPISQLSTKQVFSPIQVGAPNPEALLAKIIGKALLPQRHQNRLQPFEIALQLAQADLKAITQMLTATQLLPMPADPQQAQIFRLQLAPVRLRLIGQIDTEPLGGDGTLVFHAAIAHIHLTHTRQTGNPPGDVLGVEIGFLKLQKDVLTTAIRLEAQHLVDLKVFHLLPKPGTAIRLRPGPHGFQAQTHCSAPTLASRQTVWQAIPSPRPVKPSFSVVLALTLTCSSSTCRSCARF